LKILTSIP